MDGDKTERRAAGLGGRLNALRRARRIRQPLRYPKDRLQRLFLPGVRFDADVDSQTLLIAFGGLRGRVDVPPFEFLSVTGDFPVKRMFVRDLYQAWYHRGLPRQRAKTLVGVADRLREIIDPHGVERLVTIGNSSGGYAALVFGALLGADTALAFAPQTTLDPDEMAMLGDRRWESHLRGLRASGRMDERWVDLRTALPDALKPKTRLQVYFNERLPVDRLHAERLSGIPAVRLFRFGHGSGHYLVNTLRKNGSLERTLRDAIGASQREEARRSEPLPGK
jgi:pimeloyl-ACP methyl ester carboxylesterase